MMRNKALSLIDEGGDLFPELAPLKIIDVKKSTVAAELAALAVFKGLSRSDISLKLGWARSRVTKFLSGDANLTLAKISEYTSVLGCDFDIVFRDCNSPRPLQPWNKKVVAKEEPRANPVAELHAQSAAEVFRDINNGRAKELYVSIAGYPSKHQTFNYHNNFIAENGVINSSALLSLDNRTSSVDVYILEKEKNYG